MSASDGTYQTLVFDGLGTASYTVGTAGTYSVRSKSSIPTLTAGGLASGLVSTIKLNSSTVLTSATGASGVSTSGIVCAVGDVLSVVYTSSVTADENPPNANVIKSVITIFQGQ